jgi:HSP20 family molecular chaperone IbpA
MGFQMLFLQNMMRSFGVSLAPLADEAAFLPRNAMSLAVDVQDAGNAYLIHADVPGMKKDEVKVRTKAYHNKGFLEEPGVVLEFYSLAN